ncbi:hypothetical protein HZS_3098 [Henneguya salminicola]|nr:hypothetical protein HZS_3098 [Henneguya salminicola]
MKYLVNASKYLVDQKMTDSLIKLIVSSNPHFRASLCLIVGNFCYNAPNRVAILSNKNFYRMVENVIQVNHPLILQKLFVLLRITTCASLTRTLIHDQPVLDTIIKYSTETDSYLLCRPSALLLLLTLIVEAKKECNHDFNFINEQMLMEIANNVNPSFLASLYHNPQSNEIIFSILSDGMHRVLYLPDHVRILEKYSYFSELHQLGTRPPFRPQVILNIIPAFLRLIRISDLYLCLC